jgi:hypothetical protein
MSELSKVMIAEYSLSPQQSMASGTMFEDLEQHAVVHKVNFSSSSMPPLCIRLVDIDSCSNQEHIHVLANRIQVLDNRNQAAEGDVAEEPQLRILEVPTIGGQIANPEDLARAPAVDDAVCKHPKEVGKINDQPDCRRRKLQQVCSAAE